MRAALTFSLWVALATCAFGGQYGDLGQKLDDANTSEDVIRIVKHDPLTRSDSEVQALLADGSDPDKMARRLDSLVQTRALVEGSTASSDGAMKTVKEIKSSPIYRDPGVSETSNWLSRALDRLRNIRWNPPKSNMNGINGLSIGPWFSMMMWGVIALAVGFLIYLAVKHIRWQQRVARKASALMEEDEPLRTLDEWLAEADALQAQGRFREAVRALYLACLLRFDEARVARFQRGQTNWEHLARIEASPLLAAGLDFRTATKLFDRVWYGRIVRGQEDVDKFRAWYLDITDKLGSKAAK